MSVLDGGWNPRPKMMTITIPLPDELFVEGREPQVIADFLSGTAARLASAQYLQISEQVSRDRLDSGAGDRAAAADDE